MDPRDPAARGPGGGRAIVELIAKVIQFTDVLLLTLLACTAIVIVRMRSLFAAVMLTGIYSFLGASWMLILDAPDVAFTEAAVGAGIATILMLGTLALVGRRARAPSRPPWLPLTVVLLTGVALVYGTLDMPFVGDPEAPVHVYPQPDYIERNAEDIDIPNVVTSVLASYRGYDTFGETTVILTAAVGVLLLLGGGRGRRKEEDAS